MIERSSHFVSVLSVLLVLSACGGPGGRNSFPIPQNMSDVAGNWQFNTTSSVSGAPSLSIAGGFQQSTRAINAAVHIDGSSCFDPIVTVSLSGTVRGANISLSSTPPSEQVITLTGSVTGAAFKGTYTIKGGCADGDQGTVEGAKVRQIPLTLNGTFTNSANNTFGAAVQATEDSGEPDGTFGITGSATFNATCFSSGTLKPGKFPTGSFVLGNSVTFEIDTDRGTLMFRGAMDVDTREIDGSYTILGSTCNDTGTAIFSNSDPWAY
jgi:hypothetical protein